MFNLARLTLTDMAQMGGRLRKLGDGSTSMEDAGQKLVRFLYEQLFDASGERASVLVRLYRTAQLGSLPLSLQEFARGTARDVPLTEKTRCLTLLASVGVETEWCARQTSRGHQAIALPSVEAIDRLPMVAQLLSQLGVDTGTIASSEEGLIVDREQRTFNVFWVPEALGSPHIPAQTGFVKPYAVRSVIGFGGVLPDAEIFAAILFSRALITRETAELFKPLALAAKLALMGAPQGKIFSVENAS